jgi:TolB-like protein/Flp pilus assembly protein TadD
MNGTESFPRLMRFGTFEIDLQRRELRKYGMRLRLEEQLFQILEMLLLNAGQVVTRRSLREKLWPQTHVRFDHSLNTAINKLRDLLGDSARSPRFVETVPKTGYRFIAPVIRPEGASSEVEKKMMAVLPFENLSGNAEQDYFADGLTEEMIAHLGQLQPKRLGVIARTSAIQYKATQKTIREIAAELKVDFIMEGSVRRAGRQVRITAQLIDARDQTHLWAASYNRDLRDVLGVQADVARQIGTALAIELLPEKFSKATFFDADAHESYLRGRFYFGQRSEDGLQKAIASFEAALAIEPRCARSLSGIADASSLLCWFGALAPSEAGPRAAKAAARAIEIDPSLSEPHASLALVKFWYEWDWQAAEIEFRRAIELNPSYASAHQWYASFLNAMGRTEEAQAEHRRAWELDPHSLMMSLGTADPYFYARQYDRVIEHLRGLLEQEPRFFPAHFNLGRAYIQKGMHGEAIAAFEKAVELSGNRGGNAALAHACALAGKREDARQILAELRVNAAGRYVPAPMLARIYLGLGEIDRAFEWFKKGVEERSYWNVFLKMDPAYDQIRNDSRFGDLLEEVGFSASKKTLPRAVRHMSRAAAPLRFLATG